MISLSSTINALLLNLYIFLNIGLLPVVCIRYLLSNDVIYLPECTKSCVRSTRISSLKKFELSVKLSSAHIWNGLDDNNLITFITSSYFTRRAEMIQIDVEETLYCPAK